MALYSNKFVPSNDPRLKRNPFVMTAMPTQPGPYNPVRPTGNFGLNTNLGASSQGVAPQVAVSSQPDFAKEYADITGNRPNRLAYQQAVEQGAPQINRGKWAKLGALVAAGGSALGGTRADQAAQFGLNSYYAPQERSDAIYNQKVAGYEKLAGMEDKDVSERINALQYRNEEWYRKQAELRAQEAADESDWVDIIDPNTGIKSRINQKDPTKTPRILGKTEFTPGEKQQQAVDTAVASRTATRPFDIADKTLDAGIQEQRDIRQQKNALAIANVGYNKTVDAAKVRAEAARETARKRNEATIERLNASGKMKPGDVFTNAWIEMGNAFNSDPVLDGKAITDYLDTIPGASGSDMIVVKPVNKGMMGDSPDDIIVKKHLQSLLDAIYEKYKEGQTPSANLGLGGRATGAGPAGKPGDRMGIR